MGLWTVLSFLPRKLAQVAMCVCVYYYTAQEAMLACYDVCLFHLFPVCHSLHAAPCCAPHLMPFFPARSPCCPPTTPPPRLPFPINVLNARPDRVASESRVIALAGLPGAVTIATSMAGRGTDILLGGNPKVLTQLELELSLLPALTQGGRSSSGGQAHLVAYRSTFAVHLEALAAEPAYAAARGSVHEAAQAWVAERGGLDRAAGQALVADVLEECEELRAKYVRWARHHRHGEGAPRGAVSRLDLLRDCLERVEAFWEAHHGDRLSGTESPAHGRRDPVLLDALRQLALHVWVQVRSCDRGLAMMRRAFCCCNAACVSVCAMR